MANTTNHPKDPRKRYTIRLDPRLAAALDELATRWGCPEDTIVRMAIGDYTTRNRRESPNGL